MTFFHNFQNYILEKLREGSEDQLLLIEFSRVIGIGVPLIFGVLLPWVFSFQWQLIWFWIGAGVFIAGIVVPGLLVIPYALWMAVGYLLHRLNSILLFGLLYCVFIIPISLLFTLLGRDVLGKAPNRKSKSYKIKISGDNPLERIKNTY